MYDDGIFEDFTTLNKHGCVTFRPLKEYAALFINIKHFLTFLFD